MVVWDLTHQYTHVKCTQRSESYRPGGTWQCSMDHFFVELGWSSSGSAESAEREIPAHKVPKDSQGCLESGRQRPVPMTNPPDTDDEENNCESKLFIGPRYTWGPIFGSECL